MSRLLRESFRKQKKQTKQEVLQIAGSLGIPIGGQRLVEVPNRNSFVYVKLRDNQSEVIQAFNNQVAPSYGLPVVVERRHNRYIVVGVDTIRYQSDWSSFAPYLPRHGNTHSFDTENGGGGDIVWIHSRQMMPSLIFPSGSLGGPNVLMASYTLKNADGTWKYTGDTGTTSLLPYKPPVGSNAVMALVYLDSISGNPYFIVGSGSYFSNTITGSAQIVPYIPSLSDPNHIPLAAVRLVSGTSSIGWGNIYDVRQWIHTTPTGTGGGGSVTGSFDGTYLKLDTSNDPLTGQLQIIPTVTGTNGELIRTKGDSRVLELEQIGNPGLIISKPVLSIYRGSGTATPEFNSFIVQVDEDIPNTTNVNGGFILHRINGIDVMRFNPRAPSNAIGYIYGTNSTVTNVGASRILSVQNAGTEIFGVASWGMSTEGYLEFKTTASKVAHAGKIGYEMFSTGYLEYVGAGTGTPRWHRFYDYVKVNEHLQAGTVQLLGLENSWIYLNGTGTSVLPGQAPERTIVTGTDNVLGLDSTASLASVRFALNTFIPIIESDTNDIFRVNSAGSSSFSSTISSKAGSTLTYGVVTGNENALVPNATTQLAKLRLYNTTRGEYLLISNCNTGTNVITFTSAVPAGWANGDAITIASQTVSGGAGNWVDLEITSGPTNKNALFLNVQWTDSGAVSSATIARLHPFETFATSKIFAVPAQVSGITMAAMVLIRTVGNTFTVSWVSTGASSGSLTLREIGYLPA